MTPNSTIQVTYTISLEPDPNENETYHTCEQRDAFIQLRIQEQIDNMRLMFDTGITVEGTSNSSVTGEQEL